jgi:acyl-CoA synthetase (AMP-forming)/AMP-acid ligase II
MGLIGNILHAVFIGATSVLLPPLAIVQRPGRWLRAISHYRADTSGGPNFAYDMCVARISAEERASFDLSNWSVAAVGAEPIRAETLSRFAEVFESCGFRREAFYPCYGLAEATLMVSGGRKGATPVIKSIKSDDSATPGHEITAVGCGHARQGQEIAIVDPQTSETLGEGQTGEIWVTGESVALGYWNRPEETAETFHARFPGDARSWLRTGDLGLVSEGELFVTGRVKDLIIIRGRNHHPHDIESTVQAAHPAFRIDAGAAFSIEVDGEERLVIVQEVDRQAREADVTQLQRSVRQAIAERHELQVHDIVFVRPGGIPKTTSGKVRRSACKQAYRDGMLNRWQP